MTKAGQFSGFALMSWIALKIRQRLSARVFTARVRWRERRQEAMRSEPLLESAILPWSNLAAVPGNPVCMPWKIVAAPTEQEARSAADVMAHRFRILAPSTAIFTIRDDARKVRIAELAEGLPQDSVDAYQPIDWHCDVHSGHRWNPNELYLDVRVGPKPGADIKVPRELSRFQHVGVLAGGSLEDGGVEFLLQLLDWIVANPVRRGVNWACTMDVALRAVNWIWGLRLFEPVAERYTAVLQVVTQSLREHGQHIENNLEYYADCTGNHYLSDIAGLIYIGAACPDIAEADRWLLFGLQELVSEMEREVLSDGSAHEASTHYHRLVAELFLSSAAVAERVPAKRRARLSGVDRSAHKVRPRLREPQESSLNLGASGPILPSNFYRRVASMVELTAAMTKPNGLVPQFGDNDSARVHKLPFAKIDESRDHSHLAATAGELLNRPDLREIGASALAEAKLIAGDLRGRVPSPYTARNNSAPYLFVDSGWAVLRNEAAWLAVTCGANGMGGRGGHGHNDKNSFELNVGGDDFIVDGGCVAYSGSPEVRNLYRSTSSHSTVSVLGAEQDKWPQGVAGLFQLPELSAPKLEIDEAGIVIGRHSGFGVEHRRAFRLGVGQLDITDRFDDDRERVILFNLDPLVKPYKFVRNGDLLLVTLVHSSGRSVSLSVSGVAAYEIRAGSFGIGYGEPVDNLALRMRMTDPMTTTVITWTP